MDTKEKASWLAEFLTGCGVPSNWAKVIVGALVGALVASGILSASGCTARLDLLPDGAQHFEGIVEYPQVIDSK